VDKVRKLFSGKLKLINIGVERFFDDLKKLKVDAIQVEWKPPAMCDDRLLKMLEKIKKR